MNPPRKLTSHQQGAEEQSVAQNQQTTDQPAQEFSSVEAMLRHDALHTPVPPSVAHRLQGSVGPLLPSDRPWWRRFFGG
jgi:hypothetical protein